jgi:hypothetical protein
MASYSYCGSSVSNTGEISCDKSRGVLRKIAIFNGTLAAADATSATAAFAKLVANSKLSKSDTNKLFIINEAQDIADNSESNTEGTLGLGFKAVIREGRPAYTVKMFAGSDLLKRLRTFNNQTIRILEFDANGVIWGTKSSGDFIGFQAKLFFDGNRLATGQNVEEGVVTMTISILENSEYKDSPYWIDADGNLSDLKGLLDVPLGYVSKSTNVYKIDMKIAGSNFIEDYNIFDTYGTAIAALSASFSAGTGTNYGTPLTITSIAVDNTLKCLTVTFDSTAFAALSASTPIKLTPPTPTQLDAGDVTETELIAVVVTK